MYVFAADLTAAQRRSILGHKNFRDSDWSASNPQPSSEPIGESCTLLGDMLLRQVTDKQDKTRQDIYYQNITCTISWHAVSRKTLVVAYQINSIAKQILQILQTTLFRSNGQNLTGVTLYSGCG